MMTLAELRGAQPPSSDALDALASALSGFSESVVDEACAKLERTTVGDYEARMPSLATLIDACRGASSIRLAAPQYEVWTCEGCHNQIAARETPAGGCQNCGRLLIRQLAPKEPEFNHAAYIADVRNHREKYVRIGDIVRELNDKRKAEGKSLCLFLDPKVGDAA